MRPLEMIIKALAPWLGGKRTLGEDIAVELGTHSQFIDLACGSLAVLLAKQPATKETVNDLHGDITNLAYVVQHQPAAELLYERLQRVVLAEGILDEASARLTKIGWPEVVDGAVEVEPWMVDRAYWYFVASWMGRNGTAGTDRPDYQIAVRWTRSGGSPTVRFANAVQSLPAWHRRLQNVLILRRDYFKFAHKLEDHADTAIYFDPPHPAESRSSINDDGTANAASGGGMYLHELSHANSLEEAGGLFGETSWHGDWQGTLEARAKGAKVDEHRLAAEILREYKYARIVVSTYDCPRYRELYSGWTFIDKTRQKHLHSMGGRGARPQEAPEVLIVNGPSFATGQPAPTGRRRGRRKIGEVI